MEKKFLKFDVFCSKMAQGQYLGFNSGNYVTPSGYEGNTQVYKFYFTGYINTTIIKRIIRLYEPFIIEIVDMDVKTFANIAKESFNNDTLMTKAYKKFYDEFRNNNLGKKFPVLCVDF